VRDRTERFAIDNGLLLLGAGTSSVRFCPPLVLDRDTAAEGVRRFDRALAQAEQEAGLL
jgi:acetylornithine/succinyldiaminopimelate/putrescine aminotransferase